MIRHITGIGLGMVLVLAAGAAAQDADRFAGVEIRTEKAAGNVSVLFGAGGNIGVSAGEDGVFIIDDQFAPLAPKIRAAVTGISDAPIRYVINTHFHGDHTGGNENFGGTGSVIVAHDNVRVRMAAESFVKAFNMKSPASPKVALPVITFDSALSLHFNGEEVRVIHIDHAHTDGDSIVHFTGSNVIHMGDTFFNDRFNFIDVANGGSIHGIIKAAETALALADDKTVIIPGHGPVSNKAGLQVHYEVMKTARDRIKALKDQGLNLAEVQAKEPLADMDPRWTGGNPKWPNLFIGFVYESL